jgi:hypothetical protein
VVWVLGVREVAEEAAEEAAAEFEAEVEAEVEAGATDSSAVHCTSQAVL